MSKQITSAELAAIVNKLLTANEQAGELEEFATFQSFMTDIAKVVTDHCGGEVINPASPLDDTWYVGIHWTDSLPENGGIWHDYDLEADFAPTDVLENENETASASLSSTNSVVIVHPEMGIYLGNCMGLGFWSKLDPAGQDAAAVFESPDQAESHMKSWDSGRPADAHLVQLEGDVDEGRYASIAACTRAGLPPWIVTEPGNASH